MSSRMCRITVMSKYFSGVYKHFLTETDMQMLYCTRRWYALQCRFRFRKLKRHKKLTLPTKRNTQTPTCFYRLHSPINHIREHCPKIITKLMTFDVARKQV